MCCSSGVFYGSCWIRRTVDWKRGKLMLEKTSIWRQCRSKNVYNQHHNIVSVQVKVAPYDSWLTVSQLSADCQPTCWLMCRWDRILYLPARRRCLVEGGRWFHWIFWWTRWDQFPRIRTKAPPLPFNIHSQGARATRCLLERMPGGESQTASHKIERWQWKMAKITNMLFFWISHGRQ